MVGVGVGVARNWLLTMKFPVQCVILCHVKIQRESQVI